MGRRMSPQLRRRDKSVDEDETLAASSNGHTHMYIHTYTHIYHMYIDRYE